MEVQRKAILEKEKKNLLDFKAYYEPNIAQFGNGQEIDIYIDEIK